MPIASKPVADLSPRDEILYDIGMMIDEAATSPEDINPYKLASELLAFVEERVNSVDAEGTVVYRT